MKVNDQIVRDTLKRLPVGYYIGREVKVIPETNTSVGTSYYDMLSDVIHIETQGIVNTVSRLTDEATIDDIEADVRCMLYHELSHAMLTPRCLKPTFERNVVEDVRIENRLKGYYRDVDFKEFNKRYISTTPDDCPENGFVRFCKIDEGGTQELRDQLQKILREYNNFNAKTTWTHYYERDIWDLYTDYKAWWLSEHPEYNSDNSNKSDPTGSGNSGQSNGQSSDSEVPTSAAGSGDPTAESAEGTGELSDMMGHGRSDRGDEVLNLMKQITDEYCNEYLMTEFDRILRNFKKVTHMNSSAINAYSGRFDPRSAGREDYRYFIQQNRNGNNKGYSKVHLNLFLDESGSFSPSEQIACELIYTLCWLEKQIPNFSFTLIRCGCGEHIADKNDMRYRAHTGTSIGADADKTFKKVQVRDAQNYNILLYDGAASSSYVDPGEDGYEGNFAAYNTPNTLIITDPDNKHAVETYCPAARKIISKKYTDELVKNLIKMTEILLK